jgi:hypothetical protein
VTQIPGLGKGGSCMAAQPVDANNIMARNVNMESMPEQGMICQSGLRLSQNSMAHGCAARRRPN